MKRIGKILLVTFAFSGLAIALSSCVVGDGRISGGAAIYYGPFHLWFYDLPWLDGRPWWHEGIFIEPPPIYFGGPNPWPHIPDRPRPMLRRGP